MSICLRWGWQCILFTSDSLNVQVIVIWLFFTRLLKGYHFPQCQILFPALMLLQTDTLLATLQSKHIFISKHNPSLRHVEAYWDTQENCEGRLWMLDDALMRWGGSVWEIQKEKERGIGRDKRKWLEMTQSLFALSSSLLKFFLKAQDLINAESVPDSHIPASAHWRWSYLFTIF